MDIDEEDGEDIQFGFRRRRDETSYQYRDSSSLSPVQMMEHECYRHASVNILQRCIILAHNIMPLLSAYIYYYSMLKRLQTGAAARYESTIVAIRKKLHRIKCTYQHIHLVLRWMISYGELALFRAEDLLVFVRRRHRWKPKRYRHLIDINRHDCYVWFGLSPHELRSLYHSWRIPEQLRGPSRHVFGGEECFLISLYHVIKGAPFTEMARFVFGGDPRHYSTMFQLLVDHLYMTFYNKISGTSLEQWIPRYIDECRLLIHNALSTGALHEVVYMDGEVIDENLILHHFLFEHFRIFGFFDDFAMPCGRPGVRRSRDWNFVFDMQRAFYSGYMRLHGLKAQVVYLPIGIIGSVFITELRQNDNGVQNMSGLNDYLVDLCARAGIFIDGLLPCLYCDGIFACLAAILPRFVNPSPEQHLLNVRLSSLREEIEHLFADHFMRFKLFQVPARLQIFRGGVKVRRLCLVSFFMLNCYNCLLGTRCQFFGREPPTLDEYLPLNEVLAPPPAVNLGDIWDLGQQL